MNFPTNTMVKLSTERKTQFPIRYISIGSNFSRIVKSNRPDSNILQRYAYANNRFPGHGLYIDKPISSVVFEARVLLARDNGYVLISDDELKHRAIFKIQTKKVLTLADLSAAVNLGLIPDKCLQSEAASGRALEEIYRQSAQVELEIRCKFPNIDGLTWQSRFGSGRNVFLFRDPDEVLTYEPSTPFLDDVEFNNFYELYSRGVLMLDD